MLENSTAVGQGPLRCRADRYALAAAPTRLTLTLITPLEPKASPGRVDLAPRVRVLFDPALLAPRIEKIAITDARGRIRCAD
jgi:hypothetical protein